MLIARDLKQSGGVHWEEGKGERTIRDGEGQRDRVDGRDEGKRELLEAGVALRYSYGT